MAAGGGQAGRAATPEGGYRGAVASPLTPPGRTTWTAVDRPEALARAVGVLATAQVLAIDAEFVQSRVRNPDDPPHRLALLQLAAHPHAGSVFVVDPLRLADLDLLQPALADSRILKLFHGIGADARVLATRRLVARHTLDLEAVSRSIFGQRESGLQTMLQRACGIRLDKSLQRADWARRPLTPAMLGYAARDAEMTLVLYTWLATHYPWAIALHEAPADTTAPAVAAWIVPFLEGARSQRPEFAVAEAGLEGDRAAQAADLKAALAAVRRPLARARVIRLIVDLDLTDLAPDLLPLLATPASEERAGAARALGRLRVRTAEPQLRALLDDPVQDVREAAQAAIEHLASDATAARVLARRRQEAATSWTAGAEDTAPAEAGWQAQLRARFADARAPKEDTGGTLKVAGSDGAADE
jgi:ribonuclease D